MKENQIKIADRKVLELLTLFEVCKEINTNLKLDVNKIADIFVQASVGLFLIKDAALFLIEDNKFILNARAGFESIDIENILSSLTPSFFKEIKSKEFCIEIENINSENKKILDSIGIKLIIPLFIKKELRGLFVLGERFIKEEYAPEDKMFLYAFANQAITTIENAILYRKMEDTTKKLQRRVKELEAIREITNAVNLGLETDLLLRIALEILLENFQVYKGFIIVFKAEAITSAQRVIFSTFKGFKDREKQLLLLYASQNRKIIREVLSSSQPLFINQKSSLWKEVNFLESSEDTIWMFNSLSIRGEKIGIIGVNFKEEIPTKEDIDFFSLLSDQVVTAVMNAKLYELSITDGLTGLFVHRYFEQRLLEEMSRAQRHGTPISLIMFDVDKFKECNDRFGHQVGNYVLKEIAKIVKLCTRKEDIPVRWGGDEFAIILPQTPKEGAKILAERIRKMVEGYKFSKVKGLNITLSIGVATFPEDSVDMTDLIKRADENLYSSKSKGGNQITS